MSVFWFVLALIFFVFVMPLQIIFSYLAKTRSGRSLSLEDERLLSEMHSVLGKMENRINVLERILKNQDNNWRKNKWDHAEEEYTQV